MRPTALLSFALTLVPCLAFAGPIAKLDRFEGDVAVIREGQTLAIYPALVLNDGDLVRTREGLAEVLFDDTTRIKVRPDTKIEIHEGAGKRDIDVVIGRLWAFIRSGQEKTTSFRAGTTIAAVRGTTIEFRRTDQGVDVGLVEGKLELTFRLPDGTLKTIPLTTGEKVNLPLDGLPGPVVGFVQGEIAGESLSGQNIDVRLLEVQPITGANPFDAAAPLGGPKVPVTTPSPRPTATATPTDTPTPTPTPSPTPTDTPTPTPTPTDTPCSSVAGGPCPCCTGYTCAGSRTSACCADVGTSCTSVNDCCSGLNCAFP